MRLPASALVASGSLVAGYAVAAGSGVRALGGVVLLAGGVACFRLWLESAATPVAVGLGLTYTAGFLASHPLAKVIGAWPSVLTVATVVGGLSWVLADRPTQLSAEAVLGHAAE